MRTAAALLLAALLAGCGGDDRASDAEAQSGSAPAATVTLTATPSKVVSGATSTLSWTTTNATNCTASDGWSGTRHTSSTEVTGPITSARAYTLTCTGAGGMAAATANVAIAAKPTVTINATPSAVASGGSTTLTWSTTDATSCVASGGWSGARPTAGSELSAALATGSAFTLTCAGPGGSSAATANVQVTVSTLPKPTVTLTPTARTVASGSAVTLTWASTAATACTASGGWTGARGTSGSQLQAPINAASTYTLTCTGSGGMGAASANVSIEPAPAVTITAAPTSVASGGATTLTWTTANASSCQASGSWSGSRSNSGSESVTGLTAASAFTLTCTGLGGTGAATANVTIIPPAARPTVTISANPVTVASGGSTTLNWTSTNASSCSASGSWSGTKATSGSEVRTGLTSAAVYTVTCTGAGGSGSATVNVAVTQPSAGTFSTTFDREENPISENGAWRRAANTFTNVRTRNGIAFGTNGPANAYDDSYALLRGFGNNYTAEAVVQVSSSINTGVTHEVELLLRFNDDGVSARGYECLFSFGGNIEVVRWEGLVNQSLANFAYIGSPAPNYVKRPFRTGDVIRAQISGSSISVFVNNTLAYTATDSKYTTGDPGIGFFTRPDGNSEHFGITRYTVTAD